MKGGKKKKQQKFFNDNHGKKISIDGKQHNTDKASVATTEQTEHQARCGKRTQDAKQQSKD